MRDWLTALPAEVLQRAALKGLVSELFWQAGLPPHLSWIVPAYVAPAMMLGQVRYAIGANGMPSAVISWAYLSDDVSEAFAAQPNRRFHISEWNEGTNLWVMACFGHERRAVPLLRQILRTDLREFDTAFGYQRAPSGHSVLRRWSRPRPRDVK